MLAANKVEKRFGAAVALHATSLTVSPGTTTALIGESGCGKSTLLRLFVGLERPDAGQILFGDIPLDDQNLSTVRRQIGYVIQEGGLFPHLTARQNVTLLPRHLGWPTAKIAARVDELVQVSRFPPGKLDRFPLELSGGQRQRVSIMRALMLDPKYLFLDEPLGAIDPIIRAELQTDLRQIFQTLKKTVLLVTHDVGEAAYLANQIVLMREGRILQRGTAQELAASPAEPYVTQFLVAQRSPFERGHGQ